MSAHAGHAIFHPQAARMNLPAIRSVTIDQPFRWLRHGALDMARPGR